MGKISPNEYYLQHKYGRNYRDIQDTNLKRFIDADIKRLQKNPISFVTIAEKRLGDKDWSVPLSFAS